MASVTGYKTGSGRKKAKRFTARITLKGFRRMSRSFDTEADAKEWAERTERELIAQRERGGARADVGTVTLRQLIEAFLADPAIKQKRWLPELEQLLGTWADEYGGQRVRSFGRLQMAAFQAKLLGQGKSPARTNRYMAALRRMWTWGQTAGYILPSSPWPPNLFLSEPKPKDIIATPAEVEQVFVACDAIAPSLGALVRFLVGTGARLSDALSVTWRDIDDKRGDVGIRGQKTATPLRVAMLAPAREAIREAAKTRHINGRVFWQYEDRTAPRSHWQRARKAFPAHLQEMRLHDCRHLCASLLAANGATDVELAAQLGHATLAMVKRYSHLRGGHRGTAHDKLDKAFGG